MRGPGCSLKGVVGGGVSAWRSSTGSQVSVGAVVVLDVEYAPPLPLCPTRIRPPRTPRLLRPPRLRPPLLLTLLVGDLLLSLSIIQVSYIFIL